MRVSSYTWVRDPHPRRASPAIVHAGVFHPEDEGVLGFLECGVDDLAEEQRVVADRMRLTHLAVEVGNRLVEDRGAGDAVVVRETVQRVCGEIDVHRLAGLADD